MRFLTSSMPLIETTALRAQYLTGVTSHPIAESTRLGMWQDRLSTRFGRRRQTG